MLTHVFKPRWVVLILVSGYVVRGVGWGWHTVGVAARWVGVQQRAWGWFRRYTTLSCCSTRHFVQMFFHLWTKYVIPKWIRWNYDRCELFTFELLSRGTHMVGRHYNPRLVCVTLHRIHIRNDTSPWTLSFYIFIAKFCKRAMYLIVTKFRITAAMNYRPSTS